MRRKTHKTLTKWDLYRNAMQPGAVGSMWFGVVYFIFLQIVNFFADGPFGWIESIFLGVGSSFFLWIFGNAICSIGSFKGIIFLIIQEKKLNFSFSKEMKLNKITSSNYEDNQWFIRTAGTTVLVIRRDYVKKIERITKQNPNSRSFLRIAHITTFDARKKKIVASYEHIDDFKRWFSNKIPQDQIREKFKMT